METGSELLPEKVFTLQKFTATLKGATDFHLPLKNLIRNSQENRNLSHSFGNCGAQLNKTSFLPQFLINYENRELFGSLPNVDCHNSCIHAFLLQNNSGIHKVEM